MNAYAGQALVDALRQLRTAEAERVAAVRTQLRQIEAECRDLVVKLEANWTRVTGEVGTYGDRAKS